MDVFIFGLGCSGTTMTYSLLQSIFAKLYGRDYYSTYEPFIWEKDKFNLPYQQAENLFGKTSSISVEGIYNHRKTPMFVDSSLDVKYVDNGFFRHFSPVHGPGQPHLAKLIRGNGRMAVFRAQNPQARFLLMVRNPIDNINCAKHKFSFFGEDFYPSDYPRFCAQLGKQNMLVLDEKNAGWAQKQAEYCYQMNRAAMEFTIHDANSKILEYDSFICSKASSVQALCDFLGVQFSDAFVKAIQQPAGPVTSTNALSQSEYDAILPYDDLYSEMCERADVTRGKSTQAIQDQYNGKCNAEDLDAEHEEATTNRLRRIIGTQKHQIHQLEKQLRQMKCSNLEL